MGLFGVFKKQPKVSLEQLSYDIAYEIFPHYAFTQMPALLDIVQSASASSNGIFYQVACMAREARPLPQDAEMYRWHKIQRAQSRTYLVLEYPAPKPIDLSGQSFEDIKKTVGSWVLAPYFSGAVLDEHGHATNYFVLGQTSMGGGTVLRSVTPDGANVNLGEGPRPGLDAFLGAIEEQFSSAA